MSPPTDGRWVPRGFKPYNGTQEEEIEALKLVFWLDGSSPYRDNVFNIIEFHKFKPVGKYDETDYHTYIATLYYGDMEVDGLLCSNRGFDAAHDQFTTCICINTEGINTLIHVQPIPTWVPPQSDTTTSHLSTYSTWDCILVPYPAFWKISFTWRTT